MILSALTLGMHKSPWCTSTWPLTRSLQRCRSDDARAESFHIHRGTHRILSQGGRRPALGRYSRFNCSNVRSVCLLWRGRSDSPRGYWTLHRHAICCLRHAGDVRVGRLPEALVLGDLIRQRLGRVYARHRTTMNSNGRLGLNFASMLLDDVERIVVDGVVDASDYHAGEWSTNLV